MNVKVFHDSEALAVAMARHLVDSANAAIQSRSVFRIALAGGTTPRALYASLAINFKNSVDWTKVHFYWGDERDVANDDNESNFKMSWETLLQPLNIADQNIHRIWGTWNSHRTVNEVVMAADVYDSILARIPILDFILLGLGEDGHTASLMLDAEPIAQAIDVAERRAIALWSPHLQAFRISMTADFINHAREVAFLVSGVGKAEILSRMLEPNKTVQNKKAHYPAQLIHPISGRLSWWVDRSAASLLASAAWAG